MGDEQLTQREEDDWTRKSNDSVLEEHAGEFASDLNGEYAKVELSMNLELMKEVTDKVQGRDFPKHPRWGVMEVMMAVRCLASGRLAEYQLAAYGFNIRTGRASWMDKADAIRQHDDGWTALIQKRYSSNAT